MSKLRAALATATVAALAAGGLVLAAAPASAAPVDGATAKGRATGSGKWGYVGQFGQLNKTTAATAGQFFLPYGIDVRGKQIAVTDSGVASWESGSKTIGHTVQTFSLDHEPGSAGHGNYLGNGQYDIVNTKSSVADPADIVTPIALDSRTQAQPRGPRGVVIGADGTVDATAYEASAPATASQQVTQYANSSLAPVVRTFGSADSSQAGMAAGAVGIDTDRAGNIYVGTIEGVNVYSPDGAFLSSVSVVFDQNGDNQTSWVTWANHRQTIPTVNARPDLIGETYGLSVVDDGSGAVQVFVGDAGAAYQPDYDVHFPGGDASGTVPPMYTKPASIKKYVVHPSGGPASARYNPSQWKWALDTTFGTGGAVQYDGNALSHFVFGPINRWIWQAQAVFGLHADPASNSVYFSLNGAVAGKPVLGALDIASGAPKLAPAPVNGPSTLQDSAMNYVRGISVDDRGLVYATTQNATSTSTSRAIVQIWGMTPSPVPSATATPDFTSAVVNWGESTVGYRQPDLLDYTVKYRVAGTTAWTAAPVPGGAKTSTDTTRTLSGLTAGTSYDVCITPWNEAGSGDPACTTFTTKTAAPALTVVKTGNGTEAETAADAVHVPADSTVTFAYLVTNTGNVPLTGVTATDDRLGALTPPAGFDGTIPVDGSVTFTATGPVAAGAYTNTVTVTSTEVPSTTDTWHGFGDTHGLAIVKKGNGAQALADADAIHVPAGSDVNFTYEVTNTGNVPATGVTVSDDRIAALTPPTGFDGTIPVGATVTFTATGPVLAGAYVNTATVTSDDTEPVDTEWHGFGETHGLTIVKKGNDLVATTDATAVHVPADSAVSFTYIVTNTGNVPATGVTVTDDKIASLTPPTGFDGTIPAGASVEFTATGPVPAGAYVNTATASSAVDEPVTTTWHGFGDIFGLTIEKTGADKVATTAGDAVHVPAGSVVAFEYTVTNTGNVPATGVTVSDDRIASLTPPQGFDGTIPAGESVVFTATGPVPAGAYVNTATTSSDDVEPVVTEWHGFGDTRTLTIVKTGADKVATTASDAVHVKADATVTFEYTVTNTGDATITDVQVADDKIAELTAPTGFDGTLKPGQSVVFTATGKVPAGAYVNVATVTGKDATTATTEWHGFGDLTGLTIVKTGDGTTAASADEAVKLPVAKDVAFEYTVTNTGNVPATGVTVTDDKIAELTAPVGFDGTIAPGETVVFTATGAVDGTYRNVATVTADGELTAKTEWNATVAGVVTPPTTPPTTTPPTTKPPTDLSVTGAAPIAPVGAAALLLLLAGAALYGFRRTRRT